jgi:hypothetical protein
MDLPEKPPNNISNDGPCMVSLSAEELERIKDGRPFESWKFLPWILEYMGIPLAIQETPEEPEPDLETMSEGA